MSEAWWREGVFYQIYPRSFADGDGDGIGDLAGLTEKLDYLQWLGVTAVWLNPINPSPNVDWGYDVADYTGVHPDLGTLEDVDRLVAEGRERDIRVLLDLVPNHTSDQHPWFRERPTSTSGPTRFRTTGRRSSAADPPGSWTKSAGGTTCTTSRRSSRTSTGGIRRSAPSSSGSSTSGSSAASPASASTSHTGSSRIASCATTSETSGDHSMNRPETHEVYRDWRRLTDSFEPPRVLLGEVYVLDIPAWAGYYGSGSDELNLAFNFALVHANLDADQMRAIVAETEAALPPDAWPCWIGSNHDVGRFTTRWCDGDGQLARCALLMLVTLRGTPSLYYGDELALPAGHVPPDRIRDVAVPSRDPCRTPMPWTREGGWNDPWLPLEDTGRNVEDQRADPESTLHFTRDLIAMRKQLADLRSGRYLALPSPSGTWAWRRGDGTTVAINLGDSASEVESVEGSIALATRREREGERVERTLRLEPAEGVIIT